MDAASWRVYGRDEVTVDGRHPATTQPDGAVALPARLVFSLLQAAARLAARVAMPLGQLTDLMRTAYFLELRRRHPRDLATVAEHLGVSIRTAGTLNRELKGDFFTPETAVEPVRRVTTALLGRPLSYDALATETGLEPAEVKRAVAQLVELGWVEVAGEVVALSTSLRSYVTDDLQRRIDGVNHQLAVIADSVWARFVRGNAETAAGRTWTFVARPEEVEAALATTLTQLREQAVALESSALASGARERFALTVAVTPIEEDR